MRKIIFATSNEGKMREVRMIMADMGVEVLSLKDLGIKSDVEETGKTFEENAIIKATAVSTLTGELTLADDSGLEVDYMGGEPGVYSARFMGEDTSYHIKNNEIIKRLENAKGAERSARFVCAIAAVFPDGEVITTKAAIEGEIGYKEEGENGFGYDPIMYLPEYGTTTAGLSPEEKNKISHRGKALRLMKEKLELRLSEKAGK